MDPFPVYQLLPESMPVSQTPDSRDVKQRIGLETPDLNTSLAEAQKAMGAALKSSKNDFFGSNYADIAAVWDAIRDPFTSNGLAITQKPVMTSAGNMLLKTELRHASGQVVVTEYPVTVCRKSQAVKITEATPQEIGSALTYARRYSLMCVAGVAPADDDGNAASGRQQDTRPPFDPKAWFDMFAAPLKPPGDGTLKNAEDVAIYLLTHSSGIARFLEEDTGSRKQALWGLLGPFVKSIDSIAPPQSSTATGDSEMTDHDMPPVDDEPPALSDDEVKPSVPDACHVCGNNPCVCE